MSKAKRKRNGDYHHIRPVKNEPELIHKEFDHCWVSPTRIHYYECESVKRGDLQEKPTECYPPGHKPPCAKCLAKWREDYYDRFGGLGDDGSRPNTEQQREIFEAIDEVFLRGGTRTNRSPLHLYCDCQNVADRDSTPVTKPAASFPPGYKDVCIPCYFRWRQL